MLILFVEQNVMFVFKIVDYGYIMESGCVVFEGEFVVFFENVDVKEFYFGLMQVGEKKSYCDVKYYKR